jgi:hypothetical protein
LTSKRDSVKAFDQVMASLSPARRSAIKKRAAALIGKEKARRLARKAHVTPSRARAMA